MKRTLGRIFIVSCALIVFVACSPTPPAGEQNPAPSTQPEAASPTATEAEPAIIEITPSEHLIAIRQENGIGEFYNRETGERFVPRGMNYVRLGSGGHSTFNPGFYQPTAVAEDLAKMNADGYNVVRVFLSPEKIATPLGLEKAYMDNVADFLRLAKANQIFVMFTIDWVPGGKYATILGHECCTTFEWMNANYLPGSAVEANQAFFQDFANDQIQRGAPTEYIFSYELRNEMVYDVAYPPFTLEGETITTANGNSYDMSQAEEQNRMMEENVVYWIDEVRAAILEADPTALVSVGFFAPHGPNVWRIGDSRVVVSQAAIWNSSADFFDLHAYPGKDPNWSLTMSQYVENFGMGDMQAKPIIMGEFGGERSNFESIFDFAQVIVDWQVESCDYGFDGWIYWTWDTNEQPDFFNALMENGAVNGVLAPVVRPDACVP